MLRDIGKRCRGLVLVELNAVPPFAHACFTEREKMRYGSLGARRGRSYAAARIALKRLAAEMTGDEGPDPAEVETLQEDMVRPACRAPAYGVDCPCSVSHDDRFVVAVAGHRPIGVDVERMSGKALKGGRIFMSEAERALVKGSPMGPEAAAMRIWSVKETVAKVLSVALPAAWKIARVEEIGERRSKVSLEGKSLTALHARVDEHLFTVLELTE